MTMIYLEIVTFYIQEVTLVFAKGQALIFLQNKFSCQAYNRQKSYHVTESPTVEELSKFEEIHLHLSSLKSMLAFSKCKC